MNKSWQCPFCSHLSVISKNEKKISDLYFEFGSNYSQLCLSSIITVCPNPKCSEYEIKAELYKTKLEGSMAHHVRVKEGLPFKKWKLRPQSSAKPLPDYIPKPIKEDYEEACSILTLSPKASATLARRCLQGMIRDFWKVKPQNLAKEIESIKDKVEPDTWEAIDVVRKVGNIGAHMERDINQIVEVDENEAGLLIGLIEMLIEEWYVSRYERQQRLANIKQLGQDKDTQRKKEAEPITPN